MPRGYRLFFVAALVAFALAVGLANILQPQQPNLAGDSGYQEQSASYRAGGSSCEPAKIRSLAVRLRQRKADACAEAEEQHREAANTLIESRRAAIAAEASAVYTAAQARIEAVAAGIGLLTLSAAIAAAAFAERAAFHTKSSADAYRAREKAELVPAITSAGYVVQGFAKNIGATRATLLIANSALFGDPPPSPVPFIFAGHGRMSIAVEGNSQYEFGTFDVPTNTIFYFIGGIIYETTFGDGELMKASFRFDMSKQEWAPYWELDWTLWEAEAAKKRRQR